MFNNSIATPCPKCGKEMIEISKQCIDYLCTACNTRWHEDYYDDMNDFGMPLYGVITDTVSETEARLLLKKRSV